jgi:hypothetical protein
MNQDLAAAARIDTWSDVLQGSGFRVMPALTAFNQVDRHFKVPAEYFAGLFHFKWVYNRYEAIKKFGCNQPLEAPGD